MAGTSLRDELQQQIRAGQVVAIVGAGVSIGATNNDAVASWQGLLHHGVDYCRMLPTTGVSDAIAQLLHSQIDAGDLDLMLAAAETISTKLGGPQGGDWSRWLRETVGRLRAQQREVLEALRDLGVILATTNYDGLLEEITGLPAVTWRDGARVERILRGDETGVLHLHGYWQQPESVILGIRDYQKVLGDAHAQTMQRAIRSRHTLLYVGCGEGLHDPNFGALLRWSAQVFAVSEYRHFRLARDVDVASLQAQHPTEQRLFVLGYGPDYNDLAGFLRRVRPPSVPASTPDEPSAPRRPARLPPAPRCFGRDSEIDVLVSALLAATPEPVPILGPPGIGKSTITLVALNDARVAARYGLRRLFVRCDAIYTREALAAEIATALGLVLGPPLEPALLAELASAPAALAIDNAETPWEADTLRVEEFLAALAALPGLALIVSLRGASRPGDVSWRQPLQLPSLPLPEARKAFLSIAGDHFAADPLLDRVLGALDGVPLAIALIAFAAEGQPDLDGTWRRWQDERTQMLQRAGGTHRLLNLDASYELSIQGPRMTDEGRCLLSILSCLPGGVAHGDLDAVFPQQGVRAAAILRQVGLAFDQDRRLRLLAPLREYVQRGHPPSPEDQRPGLSHYLGLAKSLGDKVGREGGDEAIVRLTPEVANIEVTILRGLEVSDTTASIEAALGFGEFARFTGLGTTTPLDRAAAVAQTQEHFDLAARCFNRLGDLARDRSDHDTARRHFEAARPLFRRVGDLLGEANCIQRLGDLALARADHDTARTHYEAARPLFRGVGDLLGEANCIQGLGDLARARADYDMAHTHYEAARPLFRRLDDLLGEANCIQGLGDLARARADYDIARTHYEAARPLFQRVGSLLGEANCIQGLGDLARARADYDMARTHYEAARPLYQRVGSLLGEADCIQGLGDLARDGSDPDTARTHYEAARSLYQRVGSLLGQANCNQGLGDMALARADHDMARTHYEAARSLYQRVGSLLGEANCIQGLGDLALARADCGAARTYFETALTMYERIPEPYSIGWAHRCLARLSEGNEQRRHVEAAKDAWQSIDRSDLVTELTEEFGSE